MCEATAPVKESLLTTRRNRVKSMKYNLHEAAISDPAGTECVSLQLRDGAVLPCGSTRVARH